MGIIIIGPDGEIEEESYDTPERDPEEQRRREESELRERFGYIAPGLQPVVPEKKERTPPPVPFNIDDVAPLRDTPKGPTIH